MARVMTWNDRPGSLGAIVLLATLCASVATSAVANAVFTVDSVLDQVDDNPGNGICHTAAGTCTLRAATMEANPVVGQDSTIVLPAGTYQLSLAPVQNGQADGPLKLAAPVSGSPAIFVIGAGVGKSIIDAGASLRAFTVQRIATIAGVTIRNGMVKAPLPGEGGAITNIGVGGVLTLLDCALENNQALGNGSFPGRGGADYNTGIVTMERCTLNGNSTAPWPTRIPLPAASRAFRMAPTPTRQVSTGAFARRQLQARPINKWQQ